VLAHECLPVPGAVASWAAAVGWAAPAGLRLATQRAAVHHSAALELRRRGRGLWRRSHRRGLRNRRAQRFSAAATALRQHRDALLPGARSSKHVRLVRPCHIRRAASRAVPTLVAAHHEVVLVLHATDFLRTIPRHGSEVPGHVNGPRFASGEGTAAADLRVPSRDSIHGHRSGRSVAAGGVEVLGSRARWRSNREAVGMLHGLVVLERLQDILIDWLAPDNGGHIMHAAVDVVLVNEGLPVTGAVASWATAIWRAAPTCLRLSALLARVDGSTFGTTSRRWLFPRRGRRRRGRFGAVRADAVRFVFHSGPAVAPRTIVPIIDVPITTAATAAASSRACGAATGRGLPAASSAPGALSIAVVRLAGRVAEVAPRAVVLLVPGVERARTLACRCTAAAVAPRARTERRGFRIRRYHRFQHARVACARRAWGRRSPPSLSLHLQELRRRQPRLEASSDGLARERLVHRGSPRAQRRAGSASGEEEGHQDGARAPRPHRDP